MNQREARNTIQAFYRNDNPTKDDEFVYTEALKYLIDTENDANAMGELGGFYYEKGRYDLAEKYYLLADEHGDKYSASGLGYIYYYGRNGERDYKKAFYYYSKAKDYGNKEAEMKIADMLHNGYGCEKDDVAYKKILLDLYDKLKNTTRLGDPYPEVAHRLGAIYIQEGKGKEAIPMLQRARSFIAQRIRYNSFWGNFVVARKVIEELDSLLPPEVGSQLSFFDLFYVFQKPAKAELIYNGEVYRLSAFEDEGGMRVKCEEDVYASVEDFLRKALFEGKHTYVIEYEDYYQLRQI